MTENSCQKKIHVTIDYFSRLEISFRIAITYKQLTELQEIKSTVLPFAFLLQSLFCNVALGYMMFSNLTN